MTCVRGEHCQDLGGKKKTSLHISFSMGRKGSGGKKQKTNMKLRVLRIQQVLGNDSGQLYNTIVQSLPLLNDLLARE